MESKAKRQKVKKSIKTGLAKVKAKSVKPGADGAFSIPVYNAKGKEVEAFTFNKEIFDGSVNKGALYQAILMYNANARQGNAST